MTDGTAAAGAGDTLAPDELQLAFHEVECRTYDERFGLVFDQRSAARTAREVRRLVGARRWDRVVDVGCGTGHVGLGLAAAGLVDELHLLDLSAGMLGRATANAADLHVDPMAVRATAAALPYPDGAFDAVLTRGSFTTSTTPRRR